MKILLLALLVVALAFAQTDTTAPLVDEPLPEAPNVDFMPRDLPARNVPPETPRGDRSPSRRPIDTERPPLTRDRPTRDKPIREMPPAPLPPRRSPPEQPPRERLPTREQPPRELPRNRTRLAEALDGFTMYLNGFHLDPINHCQQMEAQHFCKELNDDITQCILFNKDGTRLQGVEYIVSRELFSELPEQERALWHSHAFEVGSGALHIALNTTDRDALKEATKKYVDSYGKIFAMFDDKEDFPYGVPRVLMSFTREGQLIPEMLADRNKRLNIDEEKAANLTADIQPRRVLPGVDLWETGVAVAVGVVPVRVPRQDFRQCPALVGPGRDDFEDDNIEEEEEITVVRRRPAVRTIPAVRTTPIRTIRRV